MTRRRRRLLTVGHSYTVGVNRGLADALAGTGEWDVTAIAPTRLRGDFGWHVCRPEAGERCALVPVDVHFSRKVHVMLYGRRLFDLLRQPWDLVHCWEEPYVAAAAQVAAEVPRRVPLVFATFQNIAKRYPPPFSWIERYALARADGVVAFGRTALEVLERRGFAATRVRVIPPGVDTLRFKPDEDVRKRARAALGWCDETPVVGFLGRLVPEKGLELLMRALDGLATPWRALLIGSGPLEARLRAWARRYGDRIVIQTTVTHAQVPERLNMMDVLCAPSQTTARWREQFGRMLIEAFACGVPVVASDSGEIPHVVGDGGILLPEGHERAWIETLDRLLQDASFRRDLATRGRRRAVSTFDWSVIARQHTAFFQQIIEGSSTAARQVG